MNYTLLKPFYILTIIAHFFMATMFLSNNGFAQEFVQGIDVSHYQGTINWKQVKQAGFTFAFAKATGGTSYTDPQFDSNWHGLRAEKIIRGAYHYFYADEDATEQAKHFVAVVGKLRKGHDLPPMLDLEDKPTDKKQYIESVTTWLNYVEQALGCKPIIYVDRPFADEYLGNNFNNYPLWIAEYTSALQPNLPDGWTLWSFWQYSGSGKVAGTSSVVDMDTFNGSISSLKNFNLKLCE
jgi:lysozyme